MTQSSVTLIIGSDSFIGSALMVYLQFIGEPVAGTTRRRNEIDKAHAYLDLSEDMREWKCPWPVSVAVICAGVTKLEACRQDPAGTFRINVDGVSNLIKNLVERGVFVIYLSTNQVFDGSVPYSLPDDRISPITEYGRQKAEVESRIRKFGDSVAIMRLTKVLGSKNSLFSAWRNALENNEVIQPFSDMFIAPIPLVSLLSVLDLVRINRASDILQVSGEIDISYVDAAYLGAQLLGKKSSLIQPITVRSSGAGILPRRYTTLNTERLKSVLGIKVPDVKWTIEKAFVQPYALDRLVNTKIVGQV